MRYHYSHINLTQNFIRGKAKNLRVGCRCGDPKRNNNNGKVRANKAREDVLAVQTADYDPWGLDFGTATVSPSGGGGQPYENLQHRYLYNSKEKLTDLGLNLYEYGFRWHDPQLGRFVQVDPLAMDYAYKSTYDYAENKPISGIDLDGLEFTLSTNPFYIDYLVHKAKYGEKANVFTYVVWNFMGGEHLEKGLKQKVINSREKRDINYQQNSNYLSRNVRSFVQNETARAELLQAGMDNLQFNFTAISTLEGGYLILNKGKQMIEMGRITRNTYHDGLKALKTYGDEMLNSGRSYEEVVRELSPARNELKKVVRQFDDWTNRAIVETRNEIKYNDKLGPALDDLIIKNTNRNSGTVDWEKIYNGLWRTSETFDKMK